MAAPTVEDLSAALAALGRQSESRTSDWDADVARRKPTKFKFMGLWWEITEMDFRELASMFTFQAYKGLTDEEASAKQLDFIGRHTTDPAKWRKMMSDPKRKIAPSTVLGGLRWILQKEASLPLDITDLDGDPDPLDAPPASSKSAGGNGRSSSGASLKSVSKTR